MAKAMQSPTAVAQKWATAMQGAGTAYTAGVQAVTEAPGQAAAAAAPLWAQNTVAAQPKFAANSAAVSLQSWQNSAVQKGAPRLATGATAAQPKFQTAMASVLPYISQVVGSLPARGTLDQNIQRSVAFQRGMAAYKKS